MYISIVFPCFLHFCPWVTESAKAHAPCVIFLDEIDSVGAKRTSSQMHPYANQTINQLLSEMDGFRPTEGIIVLGTVGLLYC